MKIPVHAADVADGGQKDGATGDLGTRMTEIEEVQEEKEGEEEEDEESSESFASSHDLTAVAVADYDDDDDVVTAQPSNKPPLVGSIRHLKSGGSVGSTPQSAQLVDSGDTNG